MTVPRSTVVIPTCNARSLLSRTLLSIRDQTVETHVVVVDNASTDGTTDMLARDFPWVEVVAQEENLGFGRAVNSATQGLDCEILVLVNNDVVCEPSFVEELLQPFSDPGVGSVAGVLLQADQPSRIDTAGIELDSTLGGWDYLWNEPASALESTVGPIAGPCAGAAAYRLVAFNDVGGFDEAFFAYVEDVELAIRLRVAGWTSVVSPRARALHLHGSTIGAASPWCKS